MEAFAGVIARACRFTRQEASSTFSKPWKKWTHARGDLSAVASAKAEALKSGGLSANEVAGDFLLKGIGDDLDAAVFGNIGGIDDADGVFPLFGRGDEVEQFAR